MTTYEITTDGDDITLWRTPGNAFGPEALLRQPAVHPDAWAMLALVVEMGGPERVRALAGTLIETSDDLGLLHEGINESSWGCVSAETKDGRPLIVWEAEDGEMYATDGSSADGGSPDVIRADVFLPFTVVGSQAYDALARFREAGTR